MGDHLGDLVVFPHKGNVVVSDSFGCEQSSLMYDALGGGGSAGMKRRGRRRIAQSCTQIVVEGEFLVIVGDPLFPCIHFLVDFSSFSVALSMFVFGFFPQLFPFLVQLALDSRL